MWMTLVAGYHQSSDTVLKEKRIVNVNVNGYNQEIPEFNAKKITNKYSLIPRPLPFLLFGLYNTWQRKSGEKQGRPGSTHHPAFIAWQDPRHSQNCEYSTLPGRNWLCSPTSTLWPHHVVSVPRSSPFFTALPLPDIKAGTQVDDSHYTSARHKRYLLHKQ